jgi:phenylacetate-CoA ligase
MAANECPDGGLHIPDEGMHVEIQGDRGDGVGEILLTIFDSFAFPIIRYRVGDLGALDDAPCRCGRTLPRLRSIEGRHTDFIVTPEGRCLHALSLIYPLREHPRVREFRVVQQTIDTVRVLIVPAAGFSADDEQQLRSRLSQRLGPSVTIAIDCVPQIERSAAGKFRYVISHVAQTHIDGLLAKATL